MSIQFHNNEHDTTDLSFGICIVETEIKKCIDKPIHILFTIDISESMNDICLDGNSKLTHIKNTMEKLLAFFKGKNITIQIQTFNSHVYQIDTGVSFEELLVSISKLDGFMSTNISLALEHANTLLQNEKEENKETKDYFHIFLTDGDITEGITDYNKLLEMVPQNCRNIFIGYGDRHNSTLLSYIATQGNEYRFIDAVDKVGLVYGEIIHSILYRVLTNVKLTTENCEIYNFETNVWSNELFIGDILKDKKTTYHIRSSTPYLAVVSMYIPEHDDKIVFYVKDSTDLTDYKFRQQTQELLYEIKNNCIHNMTNDTTFCLRPQINSTVNKLKEKVNAFMEKLVSYKTEKDSELLNMLINDLRVAYNTIGTRNAHMYVTSRQYSNGREQTYVCSDNNDHISAYANNDILELMNVFQ